ncbi:MULTISPECIES: aldehyde dehydrogenase family protein [Frankia]|uniref:Aldehyde dehydrogenase n=1 Tax=Frankia alni (strain DSM 45986 / CECT 9034 / ACN14a) TaxID=326424 RepID=Q0RI34_FRAAA|nr:MULTISPECIES: aldehyde dehydrogenase family protein [Frankia]CAJ62838.1 Putative aldehyde dehydrogenase [Frankia alni ACN14a]
MVIREQLYVGGRWVGSDSTETLTAINPATEQPLGVVPQASAEDVTRAIMAAREAFDDGPWPGMKPSERSRVLMRMAEVMRRRQAELVDLDVAEVGRARMLAESVFVDVPIEHFEDMAERVLLSFEFDEPMLPYETPLGVGQGVVRREPYGVASIITPYNAPFFLAAFKLAPALAAGCTTVLMPSPHTPLSAFLVAEIAEEAGLPPGVFNVVTGTPAAGELLTSHPAVDIVSFTGSDTVGRKIVKQAADTLKKVVLELGGKSANIVCEDADLTKVIPDVVMNFTVNCGQGCSMLTRTLVHESIHDDLVAGLKKAMDHVRIGDPADPTVTMGPLISAAQRDKVETLIRAGLDEGAQLAYGGGRPTHLPKGFFVEPTVFVGVENSMTIAQREFFGPVTVVIPFRDDDEAVRLANDSDFGLGGGVWSGDPTRAYRIGGRIRAGMVSLNGGTGGLSPHGPFGGYKASGIGREWGKWGLSEFLQHKSLVWPMASG